jgi:SagB-type dehydrogenase family enzyme
MPFNRDVLKSKFQELQGVVTDQQKGVAPPLLEKPVPEGAVRLSLPAPEEAKLVQADLRECIKARRSRRKFGDDQLSLEELAFLLWATQGVQRFFPKQASSFRTVPSGGARHPFETYLAIGNVAGLQPGLYRYLPFSHELVCLKEETVIMEQAAEAALGQEFIASAAAVFIWSCLPYRTEWRYAQAAVKTILLDAGHLCQSLYLACEAIGCGACAIGAYDQEQMDRLLELDGKDEFVVYLAPVGKV